MLQHQPPTPTPTLYSRSFTNNSELRNISVKMGLRVTAAAPAIASIAATALGIVLLASGSSTGTANNNYWIAVSMDDCERAISGCFRGARY